MVQYIQTVSFWLQYFQFLEELWRLQSNVKIHGLFWFLTWMWWTWRLFFNIPRKIIQRWASVKMWEICCSSNLILQLRRKSAISKILLTLKTTVIETLTLKWNLKFLVNFVAHYGTAKKLVNLICSLVRAPYTDRQLWLSVRCVPQKSGTLYPPKQEQKVENPILFINLIILPWQ